jgi:hypothetical protein
MGGAVPPRTISASAASSEPNGAALLHRGRNSSGLNPRRWGASLRLAASVANALICS